MTRDELIDEASRRLIEAAPGARIVLFGSHARGGEGRNSDLDFLVIEPNVEDRGAESVRLRRALRGLVAPMDIIVVSEQQVEEWGEVPGTVIHAALAEGRVVHGLPQPRRACGGAPSQSAWRRGDRERAPGA